MIRHRSVAFFVVLFGVAVVSFAGRDSGDLRQAIFEAEDSRAPDAASLKTFVDALKHPEAEIRRTAVRALGRFVRPALVESIAPLLSDPDAAVRAEAANALAQSITDVEPAGSAADKAANDAALIGKVFNILETRLKNEPEPATRGVIVRSIGRLAYPEEKGYRRAEKILLAAAGEDVAETDPVRRPEVYGAAKGMESLLRRKAKAIQPDDVLVARLKSMIAAKAPTGRNPAVSENMARIRRLAMMALTWAGRLDEKILDSALADPDEQVRRLVLAGWGRTKAEQIPVDTIERMIRRGLGDGSGMVRYEALRLYGRVNSDFDPAPVLAALEDSSPHVVLLAVDLLGQLKSIPNQIVAKLKELAGGSASPGSMASGTEEAGLSVSDPFLSRTKLMAAHAMVSLAKTAPDQAREILPDFIASPEWIVRMYAAEAAVTLKDVPPLERLAGDSCDNVRNAALSGLITLKGHAIDDLCLAALERSDYQLILTAVSGLKGSPSAERAVPALLSALNRLTAQKRETSRDPRLAILERLGELGSKEQEEAVSAYVRDFDPLVAASAAEIVARWIGRRPEIDPRPLPLTLARLSDVEKLRGATVRVTMAGIGSFEMTLFIDEAPATIARFVALVRSGYYNGLTIHRVIPNFLIQCGSPGAN
jgi:HEAT repeat protein